MSFSPFLNTKNYRNLNLVLIMFLMNFRSNNVLDCRVNFLFVLRRTIGLIRREKVTAFN